MGQQQSQGPDQILAKCRSDPAFKARLLANPVAVLQAQGVTLPQGEQGP